MSSLLDSKIASHSSRLQVIYSGSGHFISPRVAERGAELVTAPDDSQGHGDVIELFLANLRHNSVVLLVWELRFVPTRGLKDSRSPMENTHVTAEQEWA